MKILKRNQAHEYSNSANCSGFEFDLGDSNLDGAVVSVVGKYPVKGWAVNEECKEVVYVIAGKGKVVIEGQSFEIKNEDMIVIDKGERFYWDGNLKLFIYCTPAWSLKQHKQVD